MLTPALRGLAPIAPLMRTAPKTMFQPLRALSSSPLVQRRLGGTSFAAPAFARPGASSQGTAFPWTKAAGAVAVVGLGAVGLNAVFNNADAQPTSTSFDTLATNAYVRDYLNETFRHVGGALILTASSAMMLYRVPSLQRVMAQNPIASSLGGLVLVIGFMMGTLNTNPANVSQKYALFAGFAIAKGALLSPLFFLNPAILARAGMYTAAIVGSLSFIASTSKSDQFLYLGGPLFAGLCIVAVSSVGAAFLPVTSAAMPFLYNISLQAMKADRVMQHGQLASKGLAPRDTVNESVGLYLDFINIFIRLVQILSMTGNRKR
ncbi:hypothetical protein HDU98_011928 [Podochytrium sp. JEL0797]|nr:hypothetical protein HDU98_011928 [Podochytrium sp. JEL0797]